MKIVRLEAENVKRLKAVNITPAGALVVVKGKNGQGKTSVLDSIQFALGGKAATPPKVIREGQEVAQVVLDLGDVVVTRRWTANDKSYLDVKSKDGARHASPQAMLDKLVGALSFDPLGFMRYEPRRQAEVLRKLTGLDFEPLARKRQDILNIRHAAEKDMKRLSAQLERTPMPPGEVPDEELVVGDLLQEMEMLNDIRAGNDELRRDAENAKERLSIAQHGVKQAADAIRKLEDEISNAKANLANISRVSDSLKSEWIAKKALADEATDPDAAPIKEQIQSAHATNIKVRQKLKHMEIGGEHAAALAALAAAEKGIEDIDADRERMLRDAKMPVPGLSVLDEGIILNGLPLEQASGAEQLRVSLAMGLALNPELKVVLIRDGSLLDADSLQVVGEMAEKAGAQVWLEVVSGDGIGGIIIEDGTASGSETGPRPPEGLAGNQATQATLPIS